MRHLATQTWAYNVVDQSGYPYLLMTSDQHLQTRVGDQKVGPGRIFLIQRRLIVGLELREEWAHRELELVERRGLCVLDEHEHVCWARVQARVQDVTGYGRWWLEKVLLSSAMS